MPNITVTSLKRDNDSLREEITTLKCGFENLQKPPVKRNDTQESSNGGEASGAITKD